MDSYTISHIYEFWYNFYNTVLYQLLVTATTDRTIYRSESTPKMFRLQPVSPFILPWETEFYLFRSLKRFHPLDSWYILEFLTPILFKAKGLRVVSQLECWVWFGLDLLWLLWPPILPTSQPSLFLINLKPASLVSMIQG